MGAPAVPRIQMWHFKGDSCRPGKDITGELAALHSEVARRNREHCKCDVGTDEAKTGEAGPINPGKATWFSVTE